MKTINHTCSAVVLYSLIQQYVIHIIAVDIFDDRGRDYLEVYGHLHQDVADGSLYKSHEYNNNRKSQSRNIVSICLNSSISNASNMLCRHPQSSPPPLASIPPFTPRTWLGRRAKLHRRRTLLPDELRVLRWSLRGTA